MEKFEKITDINKCQKNDKLYFSEIEQTPYDLTLKIKNLSGTILYDLVPTRFNSTVEWIVDLSELDLSENSYYLIEINDSDYFYTVGTYIIYITEDLTFENKIKRGLGLSGFNIKKYNFVWTKGLLTSYQIKIYNNSSDLQESINNEGDNFIAHYQSVIQYDSKFRVSKIINTRVS